MKRLFCVVVIFVFVLSLGLDANPKGKGKAKDKGKGKSKDKGKIIEEQISPIEMQSISITPPVVENIENYTEIDVDNIVTRPPVELERAALEYLLCYEAYVEARKSKVREIKGKTVELMRNYRKSYANFLQILRQDGLYHPQKPKNPAGWYNKKKEKDGQYKIDWKKFDAKDLRKKIKEMVRNNSSLDAISEFIKASLPTVQMASTENSSSDPYSKVSSSSSSSDQEIEDYEGDDGKEN